MHDKTCIGDRISQVRKLLNEGQKEFAAAIGTKYRSLQDNERGLAMPGGETLSGMLLRGININWVLSGEGSPLIDKNQSISDAYKSDEFALVPRYDVVASAGQGAAISDETEIGKLAFRKDWLRQKGFNVKELAAITISGDSMAPTIRDGAMVLVNLAETTVKTDGIYVLRFDDHLVAKRLQTDFKGGFEVCSDNPAYKPQHLTQEQLARIHIVGRVVWAGGEL